MKKDFLIKLDSQIDNYKLEMINMQRKLTAVPALDPESGGNGELDKAKVLEELLNENSFHDIKYYNAPDDRVECGYRPNLVLTVKGKNNNRNVCIISHTDIVPPGDLTKWDNDPYELIHDKEKDILIGRGVEDNQQGLVSSFYALKAVVDSEIEIPGDVRLVFIADEETGFKYGLYWLIDNHPELFSKTDLVLVPDYGSVDGDEIEIAEKSVMWIKFTVIGKQAHASRPLSGNNAHRAGANLLVRLDQELHKKFDAENPLFIPSISTFEPTKKESNVPNFNTIPPEDKFCFDCRILPQYDLEEIKNVINGISKSIEGQFGVKVEIDYVMCEQAAPVTSEKDEIVQSLIRNIKNVYNIDAKPVGVGGGTVAAALRKINTPVAAWSKLNGSAHQSNEYCQVSNMVNDAKVMARLILQL